MSTATARTDWFTQARFGLFIHWGLYSIPARGEWVRHYEKIPLEAYQPFFEEWNPHRYAPKKWAALARQAGLQYVVMGAKHHEGFCLFDSQLTDYKCTNTPGRRDVAREYVEAFRAEGLRVGFYFSLIDWHHPDYPVDRLHPLRDDAAFKAKPRDFNRYLDFMHGQVRELLTNYGKIDIIWFDFSYDDMAGEKWRAAELVKLARSLQPDIIMDNRLVAGHEDPSNAAAYGDFASPEQIIPPEGVVNAQGEPQVWEACITLNKHWGYARDDHEFKSPQQIVHMLVECVSKGGNLLLNVGPTALGEFQPESIDRLTAVGALLDRNSASIYGCGNANLPKPEWGRYTKNGNTLYAHIFAKPAGPIVLLGLQDKIRKARLLMDGSEVGMSRPWNAGKTNAEFLHLPSAQLPDELDTVVALELKPS